jgi:hypothetical protein
MEGVGIFKAILSILRTMVDHIMDVWYILWSFGILSRVGVLNREISGNPA